MSGPFIFAATYTIKSGKLEEARQQLQEIADLVETNEPRLIAFNFYLDEQRSKVTCVQVHPDAASMEFHMNVISEHLSRAFEWLDTVEGEQVYGTPTAALEAGLRQWAGPNGLTVMPVHEVGFTRTTVR